MNSRRSRAALACLAFLLACRSKDDARPTETPIDGGANAPPALADAGSPTDLADAAGRFAHHPHEWLDPAKPGVLPQAAWSIGVVDQEKNRIVAEATVPETSEVTIGSDATSTLVLPPSYGIAKRVLVKERALVFTPKERVLAYAKSGATPLSVKSPMPLKEPVIVESGTLRFLFKPSSIAADAGK